MEREVKLTSDGSATLFSEKWNQTYHSVHGALSESMHVFISAGLRPIAQNEVAVLELGFGTGLNALLTFKEMQKSHQVITYHTLEPYPLSKREWKEYGKSISGDKRLIFEQLHEAPYNEKVRLVGNFEFTKIPITFEVWEAPVNYYDVIYFDAFAPSTQPELWTIEVFEKCLQCLNPGGRLVTYCAKGDVKRAMRAAGFEVKALTGPPKKREMILAIKP